LSSITAENPTNPVSETLKKNPNEPEGFTEMVDKKFEPKIKL
jgi:hypothetical protein